MVNKYGELIPSETHSGTSLACSGEDCLPPYGRLILNAALSEQKSFLSVDEILASWQLIDDLMLLSHLNKQPPLIYEDATHGPSEQFQLVQADGFEWFDPE
ncbi:hypothetical protein IPJ72_00640 [Candidatus Peregrinibacteria bacterium]|nr:MAG: hypothetical protein IPJ72_00640 [Candidatus Peregrinibacteria bacterium]